MCVAQRFTHQRNVLFPRIQGRLCFSKAKQCPRACLSCYTNTSKCPWWNLLLGSGPFMLVHMCTVKSTQEETKAPSMIVSCLSKGQNILCPYNIFEVRDFSSWSAIAVIPLPAAPLGNETSCPTVWVEGVNPPAGLSCHHPQTF